VKGVKPHTRKKKKKEKRKKKINNGRPSTTHRCAVRIGLFLSTPLLELHSSEVHDGGRDPPNIWSLFTHTQDLESLLHFLVRFAQSSSGQDATTTTTTTQFSEF
jgi:hypothetical protein